jgi:hypothetical protein
MVLEDSATQYGAVRRTARGAQNAATPGADSLDSDGDSHDDHGHHHHHHDHEEPDPVALFALNTFIIGGIMIVVYYFGGFNGF